MKLDKGTVIATGGRSIYSRLLDIELGGKPTARWTDGYLPKTSVNAISNHLDVSTDNHRLHN
jgi:hypothetical protein